MEEERFRKLGIEKKTKFDENFDELYDKYKKMATDGGYKGDIKFVTEKGKVIVYVTL